jgi:hypothetical protein
VTHQTICERVLNRLLDGELATEGGAGPALEPEMAEHLRSCVTCFRAAGELRDAPRLAALLRAEEAGGMDVARRPDAQFWDELAEFTTNAAWRALQGAGTSDAPAVPVRVSAIPARLPGAAAPVKRPRRWATALAATAAAAAGWLAIAQHARTPGTFSAGTSADRASLTGSRGAGGARASLDEETGDENVELGDLDGSALRRLLARIQVGAPGAAALARASSGDVADADDDRAVNDELGELDAPALLRVERSFEERTQ